MPKIKVDVDLSHKLPEIARNAGAGYIQEPDGRVVRQWPYINKMAHNKTDSIKPEETKFQRFLNYLTYDLPIPALMALFVCAAFVVVWALTLGE